MGGSVPPTLSLVLGGQPSFGAFTPGVARDYFATTNATVTSSAGNAALIVQDPSSFYTNRLVNGSYALANELQVKGCGGTFADDARRAEVLGRAGRGRERAGRVQAVDRRERAVAHGDLRKTLTFTLSTTQP